MLVKGMEIDDPDSKSSILFSVSNSLFLDAPIDSKVLLESYRFIHKQNV